MKRGNLISTIALAFSIMLFIVSGAMYMYSSQQQTTTSSLQVTFNARNVNFTADAWYEKPSNSGVKQAFTGNTLTVLASATESTSSTLSVANDIMLNANPDTYVLFTYKFVNTASSGGYDMLVSLIDDATKTNVNTKYYTSVTSGTSPTVYSTLSSQKNTVTTSGISLVPAPISVPAQSSLLYYILVEIDDDTLCSSYVGDNTHEITWDISSANTIGASTPAVTYNVNGGVEQNNSAPTKEGYSFKGWNTSSDGTGTTYTNEQALALAQAGGQPIMLYAVWGAPETPEEYFYWNGDTILGFSETGYNACVTDGETDIIIPSRCTAIGNYAFCYSYWTGTNSHTGYSSGITSVTFAGDSVTSIGYEAFDGCSTLTSITIPNSVISIETGAFSYCSALASIYLPIGVTSIGERAFYIPNYNNKELRYEGTWDELVPIIGYVNDWSAAYASNNTAWVFSYYVGDFVKRGEITVTTLGDAGSRILNIGYFTCFTADTDVMVYDEKRKRIVKKKIKDVTYRDILVVWNFDEGKLDFAKPLWIKKPTKVGSLHKLTFSDGSVLEILGYAHYIYSATKQRFVNACDIRELKLGEEVFTVDGKTISLISHEVIKEKFDSYSVITDYHMNIFTNGILTSLPYNNIYEIKDMKFVKEERELRTIDDYDDVPEDFFTGLRLAEQTMSTDGISNFVTKSLSVKEEE